MRIIFWVLITLIYGAMGIAAGWYTNGQIPNFLENNPDYSDKFCESIIYLFPYLIGLIVFLIPMCLTVEKARSCNSLESQESKKD